MKLNYIYCLFLLLFAGTSELVAQDEEWDLGLFLGTANYMGDLVESNIFALDNTKPAFGIMVKRNLSQEFGLRLGLNTGRLTGSDIESDNAERSKRGFSFTNSLTEISLVAQYEPFAERRWRGGNFHQILSPYVFAGPAIGFGSPDTDYGERSSSPRVQEDLNNDSRVNFSFPVGAGVRYDLSRRWSLGLEMSLHPAFSDIVDGISASADPDNNDWYAFGGVVLSTRFGTKDSDGDGIADDVDKCPNTPGISGTKGCPDADLDGVPDNKDACPDVAGDTKYSGCPDTDGDEVADHQDDCPDIPGERRYRGCPDTDGDGVADPVDICPTIAGLSDLDGCPDQDRDGITDADDACPQLAGIPEANGCPDADRDGIIDPQDKCPDRAGTTTFAGCPDSDGDGIGDGDDACPNNAGPSSNDGCPEIQEEDLEKLELAMQNVRFRTGSDILLQQSNPILNEVAEILNRYPNYNLTISGYTDNVGNDSANQSLSERRALACYQYLLLKNIPRDRMSYAGYGETNPVADNNTPEGRARNRRVEFELVIPN